MRTSTNRVEYAEPTPDGGQPIQMDLDQDGNQDNDQVTPSDPNSSQALIDEVAPNSKTKKLSVEERLGRLSEYRIRPTSIRSTAKTNGKGGKADVVQASFKRKRGALRGKRVAVKKIRYSDITDEEKFSKVGPSTVEIRSAEFVHEVELLAGLSHENIVQLVGFVEDLKHQKAWIVLSWEPNGNVREFLASGKWEIPERISLIKDMFTGLLYLHTRQPPICHGDLKSLNILISASCRAVITDFGSARVLRNDDNRQVNREKMQNVGEVAAAGEGDSGPEVTVVASANQLTLTGPVWSLRCAAPEIVKEEARPGLASDIWSAGWVCWEMMTDKVPFEDLKRDCAIMLKVIEGKVPMIHEDEEAAQVIRLCSLMTDCWKYKPEDRPHPSVPPLREPTLDSKELSHNLLLKMGKMHYLQSRPGRAVEMFERVVTNTESAVPQGVLAQALRYLGDVHSAQSKYAKAEESYTRAQEIYARIGHDQGRADTLRGLGDVYHAQSKYA
ncbi:hypothetical protein FS837_007327 [Tulasnella sp. UAMH 9824]|nr:hypothetical protein FS837_007327 [Tulasnella sp. UAMH 9824]